MLARTTRGVPPSPAPCHWKSPATARLRSWPGEHGSTPARARPPRQTRGRRAPALVVARPARGSGSRRGRDSGHRPSRAARARARPRRALPLRGPAGRGVLGARARDRRLRREHARVQLLLPAADAHVHAAGLAELVRAGVFLVTSVVVSELAARSRRRAIESALLAEIASSLLERGEVSGELDRIAAEAAARAAGRARRIELGEGAPARRARYAAARGRPPRRHDPPRRPAARGAPRLEGASCRRWPRCSASRSTASGSRREALEAEALRRSDAMKTAVLRAVSHDLRSPLMAILTSASALAHDDLELDRDDERELAATILTKARRLDRLIDNLLDLSRLEAGAATPEPDVWPVDDLIGQALDETRRGGRPDRRRAAGGVARRAGRRRADRASARQPARERAQVLTARPSRCACR